MAVSDAEVKAWLDSQPVNDLATVRAMQEYGVSPEQIARVTMIPLSDVNSRIEGVVNNVYNDQFGRAASAAEIANAWDFLNQGGQVDTGIRNLNNTQDAYNYDTNDIVAAYREAFGRNPTQEEYVGAMATLGINKFDRSSLGDSGKYTAATVAALESDPYAGRYAGFNPYQLPSDAVNVSTNKLGDQVQYISPITQRPVVASFKDGELQLAQGLDALTPQQIQAAIGLASATGGLTPDALKTMTDQIGNAKTVDDLYAAFSAPQAVASLGDGGVQTGVGQTAGEAAARGFGGVDMSALYKALYKDAAPAKFSDVMQTPRQLQPTTKQNILNSMQLGAQSGLDLQSSLQDSSKLRNFGTFGASDGERLGAGNADYQSDLIRNLREADNQIKSANTGVTKYGYLGDGTAGMQDFNLNSGGAFSPNIFNQESASPDDVKNWNAYNSYKIDTLRSQQPMMSYQDWLASLTAPKDQPPAQQWVDPFQGTGTVGGGN